MSALRKIHVNVVNIYDYCGLRNIHVNVVNINDYLFVM